MTEPAKRALLVAALLGVVLVVLACTEDRQVADAASTPVAPPPINATSLHVWCGARNGRDRSSPPPGGSMPATEWIVVTVSASSKESGGRSPGSRRASIVFPAPGGPLNSR